MQWHPGSAKTYPGDGYAFDALSVRTGTHPAAKASKRRRLVSVSPRGQKQNLVEHASDSRDERAVGWRVLSDTEPTLAEREELQFSTASFQGRFLFVVPTALLAGTASPLRSLWGRNYHCPVKLHRPDSNSRPGAGGILDLFDSRGDLPR